MEQTEKLTAGESLALISEIIARTRENFQRHSFIFLLWGWLIASASLIRFILETQTNTQFYFISFPICAAVGIVATVIHFGKKNSAHTETHLDSFLRNLWMVLGGGFIFVVFASVYQKIEPFTYTLILSSIGSTITGLTMKFRPLIAGGAVLLLAGLVCLSLPPEWKAFTNGMAVIGGYLIPGYMLRSFRN
jgi:hypothetical protein